MFGTAVRSLVKVGDLVKYESWHTALQDLAGVVIEVRKQDENYQAKVSWAKRNGLILWDCVEELKVISESR